MQVGDVSLGSGWGDGLNRRLCNSVNRDVAVDNFDACGSRVISVKKLNIDTSVICEVHVNLVNWR